MDDSVIKKLVRQSPMSSAKKIQSGMAERGIKIIEKTIRRRLSTDVGLKSQVYSPAQKPCLIEAMKKKCLEFRKNILTGTQRCGKMFCFQMSPQ